MSDDDDVSVIALSDDEGASTAKPSQSKPAPQRVASFVPDAPIRGSTAKAKASSPASASQRGGSSSSSSGKQQGKKGSGSRAKVVEPVYEDDEEQDDSGRGGAAAGQYDEDDEEEEAGYRQGGGGAVLDEQGLEYISNRFNSRKDEYDSGPSTWLEVDEAELREVGGHSSAQPMHGCMSISILSPCLGSMAAWVHGQPMHVCMGHARPVRGSGGRPARLRYLCMAAHALTCKCHVRSMHA